MWRASNPVKVSQDAVEQNLITDRFRLLQYRPPIPPELQPAIDVERLTNGCTFHALIGGFGGGVMGLLMGGFFHTMQPMNVDTSLSTWHQIRQSYRGFGQACTRMARNFSKVGFIYAGVECSLERERAKKDIPTAMYAGCVTGGILAFQAGPQAMALGCAGFAAFSAVIETFMGH
mmetsp:Transcript_81137/g.160824  ORF Transcript_81137/g.160824 Transcript_81137/m.160824 type:complete len:175 (+) Transcript_81137:26-550(+)